MQIFDRKGGNQSKQREQQLMLEQPILLQYSKEFKFDKEFTIKNPQIQLTEAQSSEQAEAAAQGRALLQNITGQESQSTLKAFMYALDKNQVLVRMTNMEDKFDEVDASHPTKTYKIDLLQYAGLLYKQANGQDVLSNSGAAPNITIEETTLTGITNYKKRMAEDTRW